MKGVQSPCPLFVSVFREAYDRTKPTEEGRASALRGRLQSVDPTKLNARSSEVALRLRPAPPGAQRRACVRSCPFAGGARRGLDEEEVARFAPAYRTGVLCENMQGLGARLRKLPGQAKICTPPGGEVIANMQHED